MSSESRDAYWDNVWLKKPFVASYWAGRPTCDWMFTTAYAADAAWNDTFWKNPRFKRCLARASKPTMLSARHVCRDAAASGDDGVTRQSGVQYFCRCPCQHPRHGDTAANWPMMVKIAERWWFA
jgi:peptide/nickel transport system substrate-binding protein